MSSIHFNEFTELGFYGSSANIIRANSTDKFTRLYFKTLHHFLFFYKTYLTDQEYASWVTGISNNSILEIESRWISTQVLEEPLNKKGIVLLGVFFLLSQNIDYFKPYLESEADLICGNELINECFQVLKYRLYLSGNKRFASILFPSDIEITNLQESLRSYFKDKPADLINIVIGEKYSQEIEKFCFDCTIPYQLIGADNDQDALNEILDNTNLLVVYGDRTHEEQNQKLIDYFNENQLEVNMITQ